MGKPILHKNKKGYYFRSRIIDYKGESKPKYASGFKTQKEAYEAYDRLKQQLQNPDGGNTLTSTIEGFEDYITKWFTTSYKRIVAPSTAQSRGYYIQGHLIPYFKSTPIDKITTRMIDEFYNHKLDEGLSSTTVRQFHNLLSKSFTQAVKWSILSQNPVINATAPKVVHKEVTLWSKTQTEEFLKRIEGTENEAFYIVAIFTGMRRGEILGLKWDNVNLDQGKIYVSSSLYRLNGEGLVLKDVKTKNSKRQISISPYVINKLKQHKKKQEEIMSVMGVNFNQRGMVFISTTGNYKDPNNLLREYRRFVKQANVPKISIHDLRHLHATLLLKIGENPKIVSERLGHSRVGITLDTYSHVTSDLQDKAAQRLEEAFFTPKNNQHNVQ